jgi:hypothetical protein
MPLGLGNLAHTAGESQRLGEIGKSKNAVELGNGVLIGEFPLCHLGVQLGDIFLGYSGRIGPACHTSFLG